MTEIIGETHKITQERSARTASPASAQNVSDERPIHGERLRVPSGTMWRGLHRAYWPGWYISDPLDVGLLAARSFGIVGGRSLSGGSSSETFSADCVAVLVCRTVLGLAVMRDGPNPRIKSLILAGTRGFACARRAGQVRRRHIGERGRLGRRLRSGGAGGRIRLSRITGPASRGRPEGTARPATVECHGTTHLTGLVVSARGMSAGDLLIRSSWPQGR